MARRKQGDQNGAIEDWTEAIKLNPNFASAYCLRGIEIGNKGDFEGAIKDFDQAVRIKPDYAEAYKYRGDAQKVRWATWIMPFIVMLKPFALSPNILKHTIFAV